MPRTAIRFWALAILLFFLAAQLHLCVDTAPAQRAGHACQFCVSGAWAILSSDPGLELGLWTLRGIAQSASASARNPQTEASAPRAPPYA